MEALMTAQIIALPINGLEERPILARLAVILRLRSQDRAPVSIRLETRLWLKGLTVMTWRQPPRTLTTHLCLCCSEAQVVYTGAMKKPRLTLQF